MASFPRHSTTPKTPTTQHGLPYYVSSHNTGQDQLDSMKTEHSDVDKELHSRAWWFTMAIFQWFHRFWKPADGGMMNDDMHDDSPFKRHCLNNAEVWKFYLTLARRFDDHLVASLNNSLDPLLIFAGLFSAILTAFLIESRKGLHEDPQTTTNSLLTSLVLGQHMIFDDLPFEPATSSRWVNGLWFTSLLFSLGSALGASVAKGWTTQFSTTSAGSGWSNAHAHSERWCGVQRWQLKLMIQCLPLLIHIGFFLFGAGLVILLFQDDRDIGIIILILMAVIAVIYLGPIVLPAVFPDFPFRTPVSDMMVQLLPTHWNRWSFKAFPPSEDAQKAFALSWLLRHSLDDETTDTAVRGVAGLPFTLAVQDELVRGSTAGTISNRLAAELLKDTKDAVFLRGCLFALLHLVQTAPLDPDAAQTLRDMVETDNGVLSDIEAMPAGVHEVALCVKGRILLLLCDDTSNKTLFETDIPVLANCCEDICLLRSLREVCRLRQMSATDLGSLRSPHSTTSRFEAHATLIKEAIQGWVTVEPKLSPSLLLDGLQSSPGESSNVVRSDIAYFLAEAAVHKEIREMILSSELKGRIMSLGVEEVEDSEDMVNAYVQLAQYDDIRMSISAVTILSAILRHASQGWTEAIVAIEGIRELTEHGDVRQGITTPDIAGALTLFFEHDSPRVRQTTLELFFCLSPQDVANSLTSELLPKIVDRLDDENADVRQKALEVVISLWEHDDSADASVRSKLQQYIRSMKATLNFLLSLSSLSQHDEFWAEIPRPELINRIIPVLEEVNPYARYAALKALQALIKHSIVTSQLATKLIARAGDSYGFVGQTALQEIKALASRDDFRSAIMTPEAQDQITSMLKDTLWFVHTAVLRALTSLASHDAVGVAIATPAIIAEVLPGLENADDIVRETTIDFVASLSEYDTIQAQLANFKEKLFFMLGDIYINVRQAAMKALKILSKIDGLSDDIPGLVNKLSTSLKGGPSQRQIGLQVFGEFAQFRSIGAATAVFGTYANIVLGLRDDDGYGSDFARNESARFLQVIEDVCMGPSTTARFAEFSAQIGNPDQDLRGVMLEVINFFAEKDTVGATIAVCGMVERILSTLLDDDNDRKREKIAAIVSLAQCHPTISTVLAPELRQDVVSALDDSDETTRQTAHKTVHKLAQNEIVCAAIATLQMIVKLHDGDEATVRASVEALSYSPHYIIGPSIVTADLITQMLPGLNNQNEDLRVQAMNTMVGLAQLAKVRETVLIKSLIQELHSTMERDPSLTEAASKVELSIGEYAKTAQLISPEQLNRVLSFDDVSAEIRYEAATCLIGLLNSDILPTGSITHPSTQKIILLCQDPTDYVKDMALSAVVALSKRDRGRATSSMIDTFFTMINASELDEETLTDLVDRMLEDPLIRGFLSKGMAAEKILAKLGIATASTKQVALTLVAAFSKNVEVCASIIRDSRTKKIFEEIGSLLKDSNPDVQDHALKAVFAVSQNQEARESIMSTAEIIKSVIGLLDHRRLSTCILAFDIMDSFLSEDRVINAIATQETIFKILSKLGDSEPSVRERALSCLRLQKMISHASVKDILLTKQCVLHVMEMLHGRDEDKVVLDLVDSLVKPLQDSDFSAIGTAFIHQPLKRLAEASAKASESYIRFVKMLPRDFQIPPDDRAELISLFSSPNSAIANRAGDIIKHFAPNPQFRREMLNTDIWAKLLQTDDTADLVVEILAEFAKYYQPEKIKIPHVSGIMAQLLIMTKANVENVDCWQPGLKGLLALGVYSPDVKEPGL